MSLELRIRNVKEINVIQELHDKYSADKKLTEKLKNITARCDIIVANSIAFCAQRFAKYTADAQALNQFMSFYCSEHVSDLLEKFLPEIGASVVNNIHSSILKSWIKKKDCAFAAKYVERIVDAYNSVEFNYFLDKTCFDPNLTDSDTGKIRKNAVNYNKDTANLVGILAGEIGHVAANLNEMTTKKFIRLLSTYFDTYHYAQLFAEQVSYISKKKYIRDTIDEKIKNRVAGLLIDTYASLEFQEHLNLYCLIDREQEIKFTQQFVFNSKNRQAVKTRLNIYQKIKYQYEFVYENFEDYLIEMSQTAPEEIKKLNEIIETENEYLASLPSESIVPIAIALAKSPKEHHEDIKKTRFLN